MQTLCYEFKKSLTSKQSNYIFQYVYGRKLTDIEHSHDFYEMIFITDGTCEQIVNGQKLCLKKGDLIFLRPGETHFFTEQSKDVKILCLSVKKDEFEKVASIYGDDIPKHFSTEKNVLLFSAKALPTFMNTFSDFNENDCRLLLCFMLNMFLNAYTENNKIPKNLIYAMSEMKRAENLKAGISAFTKIANYSQSHLSKLMKEHFDTNIHDYILHIRLEQAHNDIIFTRIRLEEIAESVGYASFSHFNKIFKKRYDISPAALRKLHSKSTI